MQEYIDLGWYTVPLRGQLKRLESGKKTIPEFPNNWLEKYRKTRNTKPATIGGAITGPESGIIAIDCDNQATFELFKALDPNYDAVIVSKGKGCDAGTFVYKYDEALAENFSLNDGIIALDFRSTNGFIYLPTLANETKEFWSTIPEIKEVPQAVRVALTGFKPKKLPEPKARIQHTITANCLNPLVQKFTDKREFMPGLFKILTPLSFRDLPQYMKYGYLHPKEVPDGRGSEYLVKVSAILGHDPSIDTELYVQAMHDINNLWDDPMDSDRLDATILSPMLEGKSSINNVPIWCYDPNWKIQSLVIHTKRDALLDLNYDDRRGIYYLVDQESEHIKAFNKDNDLISHINSVSVIPYNKKDLLKSLPLVNVVSDASKPFGFIDNEEDFSARTLNMFKQTPALNVMHNPEAYRALYKRPEATLQYLSILVPDEESRNYLLKFLRRKLMYFEYSPIILYFMGVPGSGKDTFVELLKCIVGTVSQPTVKEFLEIYNGWMLDTYFVQLDEYGNQLTNIREKEEALGKLKAYTGKEIVEIRKMRTDGFKYKHNVTFVMTANKNPLMLEERDRRISFFGTPTPLADVIDDVPAFRDKVLSEVQDFCYYLSVEVEDMPRKEYVAPLDSQARHELIANSLYAAAKIAYALKNRMFNYLSEMAKDYGCDKLADEITAGRIYATTMEEFYDALTDFNGDMRALNKALKAEGMPLHPTTKNGQKMHYYSNIEFPSPFEELD